MVVLLFFFFKQKTAYEMRISDWSSDVCSSDLQAPRADGQQRREIDGEEQPGEEAVAAGDQVDEADRTRDEHAAGEDRGADQRPRPDPQRRMPAALDRARTTRVDRMASPRPAVSHTGRAHRRQVGTEWGGR